MAKLRSNSRKVNRNFSPDEKFQYYSGRRKSLSGTHNADCKFYYASGFVDGWLGLSAFPPTGKGRKCVSSYNLGRVRGKKEWKRSVKDL